MPASRSRRPVAPGAAAKNWDAEPGRQAMTVTAVFAFAHALLMAIAQPGAGAWPASFLVAAPLGWIAMHARSGPAAMLLTAVTQFGLWLWLERWMAGVTALGYPLEALYMAIWSPLVLLVLRRIARHRLTRGLPQFVVLPIVWTAFEVLRGEVVFHGYPWYLLGHPLIEWPPLAQIAEVTGAYGVSFVAAAVSGAVVDIVRPWRAPRPWWTVGQGVRSVVLAGVTVLLVSGAGWWRLSALERAARDGRHVVAIAVQTNLPQSNKLGWPIEQQRRDVASFIELTRAALADAADRMPPPAFIAWPETMLPVRGLDAGTLKVLSRYAPDEIGFVRDVQDLQRELDVPFLIGAPTYVGLRVEADGARGRYVWDHHYNSVYVVAGDGPYPRYDKVHLTPFGEEIPYLAAWPWLEQKLSAMAAGGMSLTLDGAERIERLEVPVPGSDPLRIGTPICFEDSTSALCRRMVFAAGEKQVDLLVNLSNDGWFGAHDPGRAQHAQIARFRAIENRVPMLRCVNTGHSVGIAPTGKLVAVLGSGRYGEAQREGWVRADLPLCDQVTIFARIGNVFGWACVLAGLLILAVTLYRPRLGWAPTT